MSIPCSVHVTGLYFEKSEVQIFEKKVNLNFCNIRSAHLHTPVHRYAPVENSALQCGDAYREYVVRIMRRSLVWFGVEVAGFSSRKFEVHFDF